MSHMYQITCAQQSSESWIPAVAQTDSKKKIHCAKNRLNNVLIFTSELSERKIMSHIIIDTEAFNELLKKLEAIEEKINQGSSEPEDYWWDNEQLCKYLNISTRTLQTYRDNGVIKYSQYGAKIWYRYQDVQAFLEKHRKP